MNDKQQTGLLASDIGMDLTWNIDIGPMMTEFFKRLQQERKLYGCKIKLPAGN